jgi:hypothetical protein
MFNSFKYLELTRHHIYTKTKKMINDYAKNEGGGFDKLSEVVFSAALSLFLTYLAETYFTNTSGKPLNICAVVCLFVIAIILYCILFVVISKIYSVIAKAIKKHFYNKRIHSPEISAQKTKELIDDFDHIAFDHLIIAYEFLNEIERLTNLEVRTFYFHETLYYLRTSVNKTKEITHQDRRKDCLNIFGNVNGIDIFRLVNAHKMMCDLFNKVKKILDNNDSNNSIQIYDNRLNNVLSFQVEELNTDIREIGERCEQALADIKPIN